MWATLVVLVLVTSAGLGFLTWGLLVMHGMTYGAFEVLRPQTGLAAPEVDTYVRAFVVGMTVNVAVGFLTVRLSRGIPARRWYPLIVGVIAALVGAVVGGSALLLMLGISPIEFLLAL